MRLIRITAGDARIQWKCGFYAVYVIFTAVYLVTLFAVPESVRRTAAAIMIFTDPAAMGLFFMGAIVLMEKSQRVNLALSVSPARTWEYIAAKLLSLAFIGLIVALALALAGGLTSIVSCLVGVLLTSVLCSACGMVAAMYSPSLNRFALLAVPFELFICLPPALLLFDIDAPLMTMHPGVAAIRLITGEASSIMLCVLSLIVWCILALMLCIHAVKRRYAEGCA